MIVFKLLVESVLRCLLGVVACCMSEAQPLLSICPVVRSCNLLAHSLQRLDQAMSLASST